MIAAITAVLGFFSSFAGPLLKFFTQKADAKHELEMLRTQQDFAFKMRDVQYKHETENLEISKLFELALAETKATLEQQKALLAHDSRLGDEMQSFYKTLASSDSWPVKWVVYPMLSPIITLAVTLRYFTRSAITYAIVGVWGLVHYAKYTALIRTESWDNAVLGMWTDGDEAVMGYVLGFWFGERLQVARTRLGKRV